MTTRLPETILQFGTGKFLRAFADLFAHELNQGEVPVGRAVVVQSTGVERARQFNGQGGRYHVAIRGLAGGERVDRIVEVASVSRAIAASEQWDAVLEAARSEALHAIVSNVTEAGYTLEAGDTPQSRPPRSFPAKLLAVLIARREAGLPGVTILPCELLEGNADRLRGLVLDQARQWSIAEDAIAWIETACSWCNNLVDRIVSAPSKDDPLTGRDPLYAVTEPFALWLIQGRQHAEVGFADHPAVRLVDDLQPYYLRKVRILNGAHTALVAKAMPQGFETVRQAVEDSGMRAWLEGLLFEEILPVLEGCVEAPDRFARQTLERFANPFLEHRLADIALHHDVKLRTRLVPTYREFRDKFGRQPPRLAEILAGLV